MASCAFHGLTGESERFRSTPPSRSCLEGVAESLAPPRDDMGVSRVPTSDDRELQEGEFDAKAVLLDLLSPSSLLTVVRNAIIAATASSCAVREAGEDERL